MLFNYFHHNNSPILSFTSGLYTDYSDLQNQYTIRAIPQSKRGTVGRMQSPPYIDMSGGDKPANSIIQGTENPTQVLSKKCNWYVVEF